MNVSCALCEICVFWNFIGILQDRDSTYWICPETFATKLYVEIRNESNSSKSKLLKRFFVRLANQDNFRSKGDESWISSLNDCERNAEEAAAAWAKSTFCCIRISFFSLRHAEEGENVPGRLLSRELRKKTSASSRAKHHRPKCPRLLSDLSYSSRVVRAWEPGVGFSRTVKPAWNAFSSSNWNFFH